MSASLAARRIVSLAVVLCFATTVFAARWKLQYFFDENGVQFTIMDLAFPSPSRGIAVGYTLKGQKIRPMSVVTSNGGKTWTPVKIKEPGLSLFFLNESVGWMVTQKGLWKTVESGRSWRKVWGKNKLVRVYFNDERHGWLVAREKTVWETRDGRKWRRLEAASRPETTKEFTNYIWIEFANPLFGAIVGYSEPPRRDNGRLPQWMEPEKANRRREWPTSTIVLQTRDGGKTWNNSITSMFGRMTRLRLAPDGTGLALVRFEHAFRWPSEVYRIDLKTNQTVRVFREKNRSITDAVLTSGGGAYLAGFEPVGTLPSSPIPGPVKILHSNDLVHWKEMEADYRAEARRVILADAGGGHVWAATDTGMILALVNE